MCRLLALAASLLVLAALPAAAAPPVSPERRAPRVSGYDAAAERFDFPDWQTAERNETQVHVLFRLDGRSGVLTVALPPSVPRGRAERWLQTLVDERGWRDVDLYSSQQPGGLFLRASSRDAVRRQGSLRQEARLDLPRVRQRIAALTPLPVVLAVRLNGADLLVAEPEPAARGVSGGFTYLFYRVTPAPAASRGAALRVEYGLSSRWLAAIGSLFVLWVLFPFVALFAARESVRRRAGVSPRDRLSAYRRWQRGVLIGTLLGGSASFFLLGFTRVLYLLTGIGPMLPAVLYLVPMAGLMLGSRLIGLPLEREAWPQRKDLPWYRFAYGEIIGATVMLLMAAVLAGALGWAGSARGPAGFHPAVMVGVSLGIGGLVAAASLIGAWIQRRRRTHGTLAEPAAGDEITAAVAELTERLGCPVREVRLTGPAPGGAAAALLVFGERAFVPGDLAAELPPGQVAALVAASALSHPRSRAERWAAGAGTAVAMLPLLLVVFIAVRFLMGGARAVSGLFPLLILGSLVSSVAGTLIGRTVQKRQEEADFRVAEALESPRTLLDALRYVEELQAASLGADPDPARSPALTTRRRRLEKRLGIE